MDIKFFSGIPVMDFGVKSALSFVKQRVDANQKTLLFYANSNFVVKCQNIRNELNQPRVVIFNDGVSINTACKMLFGRPFKANLNGTDFTPRLLSLLATGKKVGLIGSQPGVAIRAAEKINRLCNSDVVAVVKDGYSEMKDTSLLISQLNQSNVDIVLVGLGNPKQETWILQNADAINASLIIGVGALLDFMSGHVQRAPTWVRKCRLEWFYRLLQEPKRLLRRYTVDMAYFFYLCFKNKTS